MRALLLVTTSTFLSVLLIGGLGYVVFQARQIEELRERERDWEARRIEREKLASEIDELARETRLFSERLVARKTSIAALDRPASASAPTVDELEPLRAVASGVRALREELAQLRAKVGERTVDETSSDSGSARASASRGETETRAASVFPSAEASSGIAAAEPPGETKDETSASEKLRGELDELRRELKKESASLRAEMEKIQATLREALNEESAARKTIASDVGSLREELRPLGTLAESVASIRDDIRAAVEASLTPLRENVDALEAQLASNEDKLASIVARVEALARDFAEPLTHAAALPPAADSGAVADGENAGGISDTSTEAAATATVTTMKLSDFEGRILEPIEAVVEIVDAEAALVALSIGEGAALEVGEILAIVRDGRPIATLEVIRVAEDLGGARVVEVASGETIREKDSLARLARTTGDAGSSPETSTDALETPIPPPPPPP